MSTQLTSARKGKRTAAMAQIAREEQVPVSILMNHIREGRVVIPLNRNHPIEKPCAIGIGTATKINANIGTSTDKSDVRHELIKLQAAIKYGADTVMDLSIGGDTEKIRETILKESSVPIGTVPVYEVAVKAQKKYGDFLKFDARDILDVLNRQAEQGVDFFTVHSGITRQSLAALKKRKRLLGIVSRGGAILASWMHRHKKENPFYEFFDEILAIAAAHDVTLSLGDGLRPGSIFDATDPGQIAELKILGSLARRSWQYGVQTMIEGPGHVPLDQIKENIALQKKFCHGAPFYVLGPLVTDIAAGYDHINAAIGSALAASYGADFLCYVTPAEHLRLPSLDDVKEGVVASKIAAHAADIVKGNPRALRQDRLMSCARQKRDWKKQIGLSIDPEKAAAYKKSSQPKMSDVCTMCGKYCSLKLMEQCTEK